MVKVAFWFDAPHEYSGGLNYLRNLLHAVSRVNDGRVVPYVFFAADVPADIEARFAPLATVVRTRLLQRRTPQWFVHRVLQRAVRSDRLVTRELAAHGIDVLSHAWFAYGGPAPFRVVSWIPDFQYLHLPEFFPMLDTAAETRRMQRLIARSDYVVLSSHDALGDFRRIAPPGTESRGVVMQFVSQPGAQRTSTVTREQVEEKYGFRGRFFFLPNQFWIHKNHMVVLQALRRLKDDGLDVTVLCTGNVHDLRFRDTRYIDEIRARITADGLAGNFRILGLIDYDDVLFMMQHSVAVLNPSRFEGWSSSVEEAKSFGKQVILSRIPVHVEQAPPDGRYFDPDDDAELARLLAEAWNAEGEADDARRAAQARELLEQRTIAYGQAYLDLLSRLDVRDGGGRHAGMAAVP